MKATLHYNGTNWVAICHVPLDPLDEMACHAARPTAEGEEVIISIEAGKAMIWDIDVEYFKQLHP